MDFIENNTTNGKLIFFRHITIEIEKLLSEIENNV